ncbi:hypothetical protein LZ30DRAFT_35260 [Colletotrichum cereale]|nr:hypothetical protein LZ30DRAFT_35260 [Colletotrichum cereale]
MYNCNDDASVSLRMTTTSVQKAKKEHKTMAAGKIKAFSSSFYRSSFEASSPGCTSKETSQNSQTPNETKEQPSAVQNPKPSQLAFKRRDVKQSNFDRTAALFASVRAAFGTQPDYAEDVINAIKSLPENDQQVLHHGCPCVQDHHVLSLQTSNNNNESEDEHSIDGENVGPADGDSSRSTDAGSSLATSIGPSRKSSVKTPPLEKRAPKRGKKEDGSDGGDDEKGGRANTHSKRPRIAESEVKHWLCPYCFACLDLPRSCVPRTSFTEFTDLTRHLGRVHREETQRRPELSMTQDQWTNLNESVRNQPDHLRKRCSKGSNESREKSLERFKRIWDILFPRVEFHLVSPCKLQPSSWYASLPQEISFFKLTKYKSAKISVASTSKARCWSPSMEQEPKGPLRAAESAPWAISGQHNKNR